MEHKLDETTYLGTLSHNYGLIVSEPWVNNNTSMAMPSRPWLPWQMMNKHKCQIEQTNAVRENWNENNMLLYSVLTIECGGGVDNGIGIVTWLQCEKAIYRWHRKNNRMEKSSSIDAHTDREQWAVFVDTLYSSPSRAHTHSRIQWEMGHDNNIVGVCTPARHRFRFYSFYINSAKSAVAWLRSTYLNALDEIQFFAHCCRSGRK